MNDLEDKMRDALRPVGPTDGFSDRVLARLASGTQRSTQEAQARPRFHRANSRWVSIALAASIVVAVLIGQQWRVQQQEEGLKARRQLIEALRVTSDKLDLAYQVVNDPSPSEAQHEPGV
jgi:hypothetical protein